MNEMSLSIFVYELKRKTSRKIHTPKLFAIDDKAFNNSDYLPDFQAIRQPFIIQSMFHLRQTGFIIFIIKLALNHDFTILANNHNRWHINAIKPIFLNHRISSGIAKSDFVTNL